MTVENPSQSHQPVFTVKHVEVQNSNQKSSFGIKSNVSSLAYRIIWQSAQTLIDSKVVKTGTTISTAAISLVSGLKDMCQGITGFDPISVVWGGVKFSAGALQSVHIYRDLTNTKGGSQLIEESNILLDCAKDIAKEQKENIKFIDQQTDEIFQNIETQSKNLKSISEISRKGAKLTEEFNASFHANVGKVQLQFKQATEFLEEAKQLNSEISEEEQSLNKSLTKLFKNQVLLNELMNPNEEMTKKSTEDEREIEIKKLQNQIIDLRDFSLNLLNNLMQKTNTIQSLLNQSIITYGQAINDFSGIQKQVDLVLNEAEKKFIEVEKGVLEVVKDLEDLEKNKIEMKSNIKKIFDANDDVIEIIEDVKIKNSEISKELVNKETQLGAALGVIGSFVMGVNPFSLSGALIAGTGMIVYRNSDKIKDYALNKLREVKGVDTSYTAKPKFNENQYVKYEFDSYSSSFLGTLKGRESSKKHGRLMINLGSEKEGEFYVCRFDLSQDNKLNLEDLRDVKKNLENAMRDKKLSPQQCLECINQLENQEIEKEEKILNIGWVGNDGRAILSGLKKKCANIIECEKELELFDKKKEELVKILESKKEKKVSVDEKRILLKSLRT